MQLGIEISKKINGICIESNSNLKFLKWDENWCKIFKNLYTHDYGVDDKKNYKKTKPKNKHLKVSSSLLPKNQVKKFHFENNIQKDSTTYEI
jgi:hypothetical protein